MGFEQICDVCSSDAGFARGHDDDGFFYCRSCNAQADDIYDTGVDEEQIFSHYNATCNRVRPSNVTSAEPVSQVRVHTPIFMDDDDDDLNGRRDFGLSKKKYSYEDYYSEIRSRYVTGIQVMIQLQCQALVEKFNVSPLIVGLAGPLWLRFLASTRIMADDWADQAVHFSETQTRGDVEEFQPSAKSRSDPVNIYGKRVVYVWYRSVRSAIPIPCSLAISFLICHVAREAILPSDILKWIVEGKLPYFAAFSEIEKQLGSRSEACPIPASRMFRPTHPISSQRLESMAADIAKKIGLELPPVNFYAIASRYFLKLSLPTKDILPLACQICEWSIPSELYLSANEFRIPTRACVMSLLIVAIRILFNINGYGTWESSLSSLDYLPSQVQNEEKVNADRDSSSDNLECFVTESDVRDSRFTAVELLRILEKNYDKLDDAPAYSSDLLSYLEYCKEVVFSGLGPLYEDLEEERLLEDFWDVYQNKKPVPSVDNQRANFLEFSTQNGGKKTRHRQSISSTQTKKRGSDCDTDRDNSSQDSSNESQPPNQSAKDEAIKQLMLDMEENKFCYLPPRSRVKRKDYLHYTRRKKDVLIYAVHSDYYILLRPCAKVAQVEARMMHIAVLCLERRLEWLEKRIDSSVSLEPGLNYACNLCGDHDDVGVGEKAGNDPVDLSS